MVASTSSAFTAAASGRHSPPRRCTDEAAISMHSRTVCSPKTCGSWNERPTPSRVIARGLWPVTSRPSKNTWPASAFR